MASPTPPTGPRVHISATHVKVMRIKDGVARLQFGGHFWDVSILELGVDATGGNTSKKLNLTDDLASKVQGHFQKLADEGVFDSHKSRKVILEGRRTETPAAAGARTVDIAIDKVESEEDAATGLKAVDLAKISSVAQDTLKAFGKSLVDSDIELHEDPSVAKPPVTSPSPSPTPAPPTTAKKTAPKPADKATRTVSKNPLQAEFKGRDATPITDPAATIHSSFYKGPTVKDGKAVQEAMATYIGGTTFAKGQNFETSPRFDMVLHDLQHIAKHDKANLDAAAAKFKGGAFSSGTFISGELDGLLSKDAAAISAPEKKKLVQLYAQYLRDGHKGMGSDFYNMFTLFSRDGKNTSSQFQVVKQIVILEENKAGKIEIAHEFPKETISPGHRIYLLKKGDSYSLYEKAADATRSLSAIVDIKTLAATTDTETVHQDVGGKGRGADRSLAHQILVRGGKSAPTDAEITTLSNQLRASAAIRLRDASFTARTAGTADTANTGKLKASMNAAIATGLALPSQKREDHLLTLQSAIGTDITIDPAFVDALNKLPTTGPRGDVFDRLKGHIHAAFVADKINNPSGAVSSDRNFGATTLNSATSGSADAERNTGYIKAALQKLIQEEKDETNRIDALSKETRPLTDPEALELSTLYADIIENDPEVLDQTFFAALSEVEDTSLLLLPAATSRPKYQIAIITDNTGADKASKPYKIHERHPAATSPIDKLNTLYIWHDAGSDHYHSFQREGETIDEVTA